jgi:hypothetical protein
MRDASAIEGCRVRPEALMSFPAVDRWFYGSVADLGYKLRRIFLAQPLRPGCKAGLLLWVSRGRTAKRWVGKCDAIYDPVCTSLCVIGPQRVRIFGQDRGGGDSGEVGRRRGAGVGGRFYDWLEI